MVKICESEDIIENKFSMYSISLIIKICYK